MHTFIIDEMPQMYQPTLAKIIGLHEAIFVQQLKYRLNESNHLHAGKYWVCLSQENWLKEFPFWSKSSLQKIIAKLKKQRIIDCCTLNRSNFDRTIYYALDMAILTQTIHAALSDASPQPPSNAEKAAESNHDNVKSTNCDSGILTTSDCRKMTIAIPENTKDNQSDDDYARVAKSSKTQNALFSRAPANSANHAFVR